MYKRYGKSLKHRWYEAGALSSLRSLSAFIVTFAVFSGALLLVSEGEALARPLNDAPDMSVPSVGRAAKAAFAPDPKPNLSGPAMADEPLRDVAEPVIGSDPGPTVAFALRESDLVQEPPDRHLISSVPTTATEPIRDAADPVIETAHRAVKPLVEPIRQTVEPTAQQVHDMAEPVNETVHRTAEPVRQTVEPAAQPVRDTTESVAGSRPEPVASTPGERDQTTLGSLTPPAPELVGTSAAVPDLGPVAPKSVSEVVSPAIETPFQGSRVLKDSGPPAPEPANAPAAVQSKDGAIEASAPSPAALEGLSIFLSHVLDEYPTAFNSFGVESAPSRMPGPFSTGPVPAVGPSGGLGSGTGASLAVLALLLVLSSLGRRPLWSFAEPLRPNSALHPAIERPG